MPRPCSPPAPSWVMQIPVPVQQGSDAWLVPVQVCFPISWGLAVLGLSPGIPFTRKRWETVS